MVPRVVTVADPVAVSRAWALFVLARCPRPQPGRPARGPRLGPRLRPLARDASGATDWSRSNRLALNHAVLDWSRSDPEGLLAAARQVASRKPLEKDGPAERLLALITTETNPKGPQLRHNLTDQLLDARPEALVEAIQILNSHRDEVVKVMTRYGYTDPRWIGGYLDRDLPAFASPK